jgi:hypothetical protein
MPLSRAYRRPVLRDRKPTHLVTVIAALATLGLATHSAHAAEADAVAVAERYRQNNPAPVIETSGWRLRPLAELRTGFTDNVNWRADEATASTELGLRGSLEASREAGIMGVSLSASHATTIYAEGPNRTAQSTAASAVLTLRLTPQAELRASIGAEDSQEPSPANGIEIDDTWVSYSEFPRFERLPLSLSLMASFGRHRLEVEGTTTYTDYDDLLTVSDVLVSQDFRSGWNHELRARATWSTHATLEAFIEGEIGIERYINDTADTDRFSIAVGALFEPHPLLRTELLAGYAHQDYRIANGASGLVFASELTWYMSPLVTITLDAQREFRGNVVSTAGGSFATEPATSDRIGIVADWEPLRHMLVSLETSWTTDETDSGARRDTFLSLGLRAQYAISEQLQARLEIEHQSGESSVIGNVSRNRISVGLSTPY